MSREAALQRAIADACLGESSGQAIATDLRRFLEDRGVTGADVEAALAAAPRLAVYRSLVRNGLSAAVVRALPRTRARMNAACDGRFDADFSRFLDERAPRTRCLRDVADELFAWAAPRWRSDPTVPSYLPDLASFELAVVAVAAAQDDERPVGEVAIDRPLAITSAMRLLHVDWAVHDLSADGDGTDLPARRAANLLAYRDRRLEVRWLELSPLAADVVDRWRQGEPMGRAIERSCDTINALVDRESLARLLADLADRGVVLGGAID